MERMKSEYTEESGGAQMGRYEVDEGTASGAGLVLFRRLEHVRCAERPGVRRQKYES